MLHPPQLRPLTRHGPGWVLLCFALAVLVFSACSGDEASGTGGSGGAAGAGGNAGSGGTHPSPVDYLTELSSSDDFAALARRGAEVKYLAAVTGRKPPAPFSEAECVFQNTEKYDYHIFFLRSFPEHAEMDPARYEDLVLRRDSRVFWGGTLKLFAATPHPLTERAGVLAYFVYAGDAPSEALTVEDLTEIDRRLKSCAPYAAELLAFVPDGERQLQRVRPLVEELNARGVAVVEPSALRPGLFAEAYSEGESYGYLRVVPRGQAADAVSPRDVLIVESAPNDLTLVAGLVTALPQSQASHTNLRLREKGIPSSAVSDIYENAVVQSLTDRLVRLVVTEEQVTLEPARIEEAEAFWAARRPDVGELRADLDVVAFLAFSDLDASDASSFGVKAANLGELHGLLEPRHRPEGFGIPFSAYRDFVEENGLDAEIESLLADPRLRTDAAHRRARLGALRASFRAASLSASFLERLDAAIVAVYGDAGFTTRLRFRSSTNAEDLTGLTGAGLYDSRSGCRGDDLDEDSTGPSTCLSEEHEHYLRGELERRLDELREHPERTWLLALIEDLEDDLANEKSAELAVRRVWASLWNERAFDDREYYGLDHRRVFMGIAVHPTFVGEQLEAVAFTNLEPASSEPLYRVISQAGEVGVVRPDDPSAVPEVLTLRRGPSGTVASFELVAPSSLSPGGAPLWSSAARSELAGLLFRVHDHFAAEVYPEIEPLSLDLEIDVTAAGDTVVKQVRPYPSEL